MLHFVIERGGSRNEPVGSRGKLNGFPAVSDTGI